MKAGYALFFLLTVLLSGCAATSPPHGAPPPFAGGTLEEQFVRQTVFSLRDSFVTRDTRAFMKHVSDGFYLGYRQLARGLEEEFAVSGALGLAVEVAEVTVDDPRVTALVRWRRTRDGSAAASGTTELIFQRGDTVSLVNVHGDPLFGMAGF